MPTREGMQRTMRSVRLSLMLVALAGGCGGRSISQTSDAGTDLAGRIGPVDLSQAPAVLGMTCGADAGGLAFEMPCLVGMNLAGSGQAGPGWHATECRMAQAGTPLAWSFILPLQAIARDPGAVLTFPGDVSSPPPAPGTIDLRGEPARVSSVTGTLTFSRVDPSGRAFIGAFSGTVTWKATSGAETTCTVDGPFWGAPGGFI